MSTPVAGIETQSLTAATARARRAVGAATLTLALCGGLHAIRIVASAAQVELLGRMATRDFTHAEVVANDGRIAMLGSLVYLSMAVCALGFLRWMRRAYAAAPALGVQRLELTAGQAAWSFFLPIVSLFRPYQALRDLHDRLSPMDLPEPAPRVSHTAEGHYRENAMALPSPPIATPAAPLGLWWGLWLASRFAAYGTGSMSQEPHNNIPTLIHSTYFTMFVDLIEIAAAVAAILVVRRIDARIAERARRLEFAADPPPVTTAAA